MNTALIAITLVSLTMTLVMAAVTWRLLHDERRRSAARTTMLEAELPAAGGLDVPPAVEPRRTVAPDVPLGPPSRAERASASLAEALGKGGQPAVVPPRPARRETSHRTAVPDTFRSFAGAEPSVDAPGAATLFGETTRDRPAPRRLLAVAAMGMLLAVAAGTALITSDETPVAANAAIAKPGAALELLSLKHTRQADTLTVTGLVRNPVGSPPIRNLTAVAFVFDGHGGFLGSARAPLDFRTLGAGDESPFVITVPVNGAVGRYRVSFRDESGAMAPHVDRRSGT